MTETSAVEAARMVDLGRYPIHDADSEGCAAFVRECRSRFVEDGLCVLPEFIRLAALEVLAEEANGCAGDAWFCNGTHNVYLTQHDAHVPPDDVARRQERTYVGSVPYDRIGDDSSLRRLYLWDPLKDFIGSVLGKPRLHRSADPLGACSVNVFVDGGAHGWHFDESEFSVTLMLQAPESGGSFEYVPGIRGSEDEKSIVAAVLDGDRARVRELPFTAGTLLIFGGRQTLHRVTRVGWSQAPPRAGPYLCRTTGTDEQRDGAQAVLGAYRHGKRIAKPRLGRYTNRMTVRDQQAPRRLDPFSSTRRLASRPNPDADWSRDVRRSRIEPFETRFQIRDQIVGILQPDVHAQQERRLRPGIDGARDRHPVVGDEALVTAPGRADAKQLEPVHHAGHRRLVAGVHREPEQAGRPGEVPLPQRMTWIALQGRIEHPLHLRTRFEPARNLHRRCRLPFEPHGKTPHAA